MLQNPYDTYPRMVIKHAQFDVFIPSSFKKVNKQKNHHFKVWITCLSFSANELNWFDTFRYGDFLRLTIGKKYSVMNISSRYQRCWC